MIPILYEKNEVNFTSNGLGRLRDCISCVVTEERNGVYECDFEYPVDGANYDLIQIGRIVGVTHDEGGDIQPFDIVSFEKPIDGIVTFHCTHISYRMSYMTVRSNVARNDLASVLSHISTYSVPACPFTFWTNKTSTGYCAALQTVPYTVRQVLGGTEGSILDAYGGEYEWDKWTVKLWASRGENRDFSIRYGVNMMEYDEELDSSGCYSSCRPYWTDGTTTIIGDKQTATGLPPSGREQCIPLDVSDKFEAQPTKAEVEAMGLSVMNGEHPTNPTQNIKVSFVRLQDLDEYPGYENLLQCKLCDTIEVFFPDYNSSENFKIVKTVWNVLRDKYEEMELGDLSTTLAEALGVTPESSGGGSSGGGGGTSNYNDLTNKPQINSVTLSDNKSLSDLGINIPTITDTYSGTSSDGMSGKAVKSAIDALDGTVSGSAGADKTLTAFSQTDGKVSATFGNINITKSQISDFPTIPTVNDATLTIQKNGTNVNTFTANASANVTANITVPTDVSELNNDSGFITSPDVVYCTSSTASGTAAKTATIVSGTLTTLTTGCQAIVKFTNANGVASPTLKVGNTDAKAIRRYGSTAPSTSAATSWNAGSCVLFVYDGTYWYIANYLNSTYSEISSANITNGSGSTTGLVTGRRAKAAVEAFAPVTSVNSKTGAVSLGANDVGAVPTTRTVNSKALSADITLTASDVGALPDTTTIPTKISDLTNDLIYDLGVVSPVDNIFSVSADDVTAITALWNAGYCAVKLTVNSKDYYAYKERTITYNSLSFMAFVSAEADVSGALIKTGKTLVGINSSGLGMFAVITDLTDDDVGTIIGSAGLQEELVSGTNIKTINGATLLGSGNIVTPNTVYSTFTGTDGADPGTDGLVPAPLSTDAGKYLKSDGTWSTVSGGGGLTPLIGSSADIAPSQVKTALREGRDICIAHPGALNGVNLDLRFTSWNGATDTDYYGYAIDIVASQTIAYYSGTYYLFELVGGVGVGWELFSTALAQVSDIPTVPEIRRGRIAGTTVAANAYVDVPVLFDADMGAIPNVVCGVDSNSTAGAIGSITAAVLTGSVTVSGFTCRIFNAGTSSRIPAVQWIAVSV